MQLRGRKAIITGAGRGLGRALAITLADAGADVFIAGRDPSKLTEVANTIAARGLARPECVALDLADKRSVETAAAKLTQDAQPLDILVNNGAKWLAGSLEQSTNDEIAELVASHLTGTILLTRALLPSLRRSTLADILTIVSTSGLPHAPLGNASPAFHAAKRGQAGFADGLRQSLIGTGVRSTAIYPPDIEDIQPDDPDWSRDSRHPKSGLITNRDVVEAAVFVLSRPRHVSVTDLVLNAGAGPVSA